MVAAAAHPLKRSKSADAIASGCRLLICMSMECVCASQLRHFVHAPILAELLDLAQQILCGNFPCPSDRQPSPGAEGKTSSQVCGEGLRAVDRRHLAGRLKALCKRHCLTEEVIAQHTLAHHAANARTRVQADAYANPIRFVRLRGGTIAAGTQHFRDGHRRNGKACQPRGSRGRVIAVLT